MNADKRRSDGVKDTR